MKLSGSWLGRYVKLDDLHPQEIAWELSTRTCEVESVRPYGHGLDQVVVGKVVECARHPNADKLSVTKVDVGGGAALQIVCGAPNVAKGQSVAVAKPGTTLPDGSTLKTAKLRGVESQGMILSEKELGLGEEHDGILVLETGSKPGTPFYEVEPVRDWILEIDNKSVTHRPDLWGHYGFARELAAIFRRPLEPLVPSTPWKPPGGKGIPVEIVDPRGCFRYLALEISGIRVGASPGWMRRLLRAIGQRPINNLVDASNFLMFEIGQPTHAFDRAKIRDGRILVRRARPGEELTTLDGTKRKLSASDLLIADPQGAIGIAGVMGGQNSEVCGDTHGIVLESAVFDPVSVRRSAQAHSLRSEASARFEKSLDPAYADEAVRRFAELLPEISPGAKLESYSECVGDRARGLPRTPTLGLDPERVSRRLGVALSPKEIAENLGRLQFQSAEKKGRLETAVPSFRATKDVTIEEDLIEEIGRIYGYGKIPERALIAPVAPPPRDPLEDERRFVRLAKERMSKGFGFSEACHYSFLPDKLAEALRVAALPYVTLANPIIQEQSRVRRSPLPSLLADLEPALRLREEVRLFEVGKGYRPEQPSERGEPREVLELAAVWAWRKKPEGAAPFFRGKGIVRSLLEQLGCSQFEESAANQTPQEAPFLKASSVQRLARAETPLGFYGEIEPRIAKALATPGPVLLLCLDLRALLAQGNEIPRFQALPKFPGIQVDVAVAVPADVSYRETFEAIQRAGGKLLADLQHFDSFWLKDGQKSFAFHALLQSPERTLTEKEEQEFIEKVAGMAKQLGGQLRR